MLFENAFIKFKDLKTQLLSNLFSFFPRPLVNKINTNQIECVKSKWSHAGKEERDGIWVIQMSPS